MSITRATTKTHRSRADVREQYGHPWPWQVEPILRKEFVEDGRTKQEIAERFVCDSDTVRVWLRRHGIRREGDA